MSSHRKSSHGDSSRRHGSSSGRRGDSPPRRSRRSPSPGPSRDRSPKPRDPKNLPESFGRVQQSTDDDLNILQRMKTSYVNSPLHNLYKYVKDETKVKVWTRNYKEVRGILSGYVIAFDKHWNLILRDVDEVYLMPKKSKTPFLRDVEPGENLPDMPVKVPREKRPEGTPAPVVPKKEKTDDEGKKKRRKKKSKKTSEKRNVGKLFVRGDNIVMICPLNEEDEGETEEGEGETEEGEGEAEVEEIEEEKV